MRFFRDWMGAGLVMTALAGCGGGGGGLGEGIPKDTTAGAMPSMEAGKDALKHPSSAPVTKGGTVLAK